MRPVKTTSYQEADKFAGKLEESALEKFLLRAAGQSFFNTSRMSLNTLGTADLKTNLLSYVESFSPSAREIFEHFKFSEFVNQLAEANLLYKVIEKVATTDLSPAAISNHDMGLVFEELIRRFAESSNETAGEHFTPRDVVNLTTSLVFAEDNDALIEQGIVPYGQELNAESYAICKGDMLIKGQDVERIKLGNTLSNDQLPSDQFDYMLANPPFGVDWKKVEKDIKSEHTVKGFGGRFGPGLPRVSDGSMLFLLHLLSKMRDYKAGDKDAPGSRIGIILNGSPLFTGGAGSGESEIRRHILENDLLEAIVALPTDMFYNTGIATYIWVLSNKKTAERQGHVQLINGVHLYQKMRKSLGSKRQEISDTDRERIVRTFVNNEAVAGTELAPEAAPTQSRGRTSSKKAEPRTFASKLFATHAFGYRRITIERPLRLSVACTDERIASLRYASGTLAPAMQALYTANQTAWETEPERYGQLDASSGSEARALLKADFPELKEKQIKDLLAPELWHKHRDLLAKAGQLQAELGTAQQDDFNQFETQLKAALSATGTKLDAKEKKQFIEAISWTNPDAAPVIKKVLKTAANPLYGHVEHQGQIVQFQPDSNLRDCEDVPLTADTARGINVNAANEAYFQAEVAPHVADAWIDPSKCDSRDEQIGIVGFEIPFNRHFYQYQPPRDLAEIDADLDVLSKEIMAMLAEVHS